MEISEEEKEEMTDWLIAREECMNELDKKDKKYIVQLTDKEYRNLVDIIRNDLKKEFKQKIKDKIEELKVLAKRIAGTYQYADSEDDLIEKKNKVIELRTKAEALEELLQRSEDRNAN